MSAFVVDVNVAVVANGGRSPQADDLCRLHCIRKLKEVRRKPNRFCIDDRYRILREYERQLPRPRRRQGGPGDEFMGWVYQNQWNVGVCERVSLTPRAGDDEDYEEIPRGSLDGFDRSDRKYLAVALTSQHHPTIVNAVDPGWRDFALQLQEIGVSVGELCPQCLRSGR